MPAVAFHFNLADPRDYCCRLLRKADRAGAKLMVHGAPQALADLDRLLWFFDPLEFVPHWRGARADALPARLASTPVLLVEQLDEASASRWPVLINLQPEVPAQAGAFQRVIELVGQGAAEREAARQRWRWYAAQQWPIERHDARS